MALALVAGVLPALAPAQPAAAAPALPGGFSLATEESGQAQYDLTDFTVLADGSKITLGKSGKVAWVSADQKTVRKLAQIPVHDHFDLGLIGLWPAPNYDDTGHVYLVYPKPGPNANTPGDNEVARYTVDNPKNPTTLGAKLVVLGGVKQDINYHGAGTVLAAPDGSIYAGFGDSTHWSGASAPGLRAQSVDDPHGKILRFDAQGRGWPTNPFYDAANPSSWRSRVFAMGMRNPTRFTLDPRSGRVYLGDVGAGLWEEVNVARGGENFGWPCYEGNVRSAGYQGMAVCKTYYSSGARYDVPLYTYPHAGAQAAVIGGPFYSGTSYPAAYRGKLFFGDYSKQVIRTIGTDLNDKVTSPAAVFGTGIGAPVAIRPEINGDLAYADLLTGKIKRLRYAAGNRPPTAAAKITNNPAASSVTVDASDSSDLDGDVLTYLTDFGDGTAPVAGVTATHVYADGNRSYAVTMTAKDPLGAKDTVTMNVKPSNHTPQLVVTLPPPATRFAVATPVTIGATATDQESGQLVPHYDIVLQHCPYGAGCHAHPDGVADGPSLTRPFPDHGDDTKMVITVSVTDGDGATVSEVYEALPDVRQLTLKSPVPVTLNGLTTTSLPIVAGAQVEVAAPALSNGRQFNNWSDGGAATHTFAMPAADLVLTASYLSEIDTRYAAPGLAAKLGPATTSEKPFTAGALLGGRYRHYKNGVIMWSRATGAHDIQVPIMPKYWSGALPTVYGFPISNHGPVQGGVAVYFQRGRAYYSAASGVHFVKGAILNKYLALGGPAFGLPTSDETITRDRRGYFNHFTNGRTIYWTATTGGHNVQGAIRAKYASIGWERSCLGYPTSDEFITAGRYQSNFQHGTITWSRAHGAAHRCV